MTDLAENTHKFWEVRVRGSNLELRFGRIGTRGQTRTKAFDSDDEARAAAVSMYEAKEKKGYRHVESSGPKPSREAGPTARAAIDPAVLEALRAEPDAAEAHLVFADHLQAQGDPLGELIALGVEMHGLQDVSRFMALQARREALLEAHQRAVLGPLADLGPGTVRLDWRFGLVRRATVLAPEAVVPADLAARIEALTGSPACLLLRILRLEVASLDAMPFVERALPRLERLEVDTEHDEAARARLLASPLLRTLRQLEIAGAISPTVADAWRGTDLGDVQLVLTAVEEPG